MLVRQACPEFFTGDGHVKKTSTSAYNAALFRHFLVGLEAAETKLLSRLKVKTFEEAITELKREESLENSDAERSLDEPSGRGGGVHWASPVLQDAALPGQLFEEDGGDRGRRRGQSSPFRSGRRSPQRRWSPQRSLARHVASPARGRLRSPGRPPQPPAGASGDARPPDSAGGRGGGERVPRCWGCRGWGHLKRECPNAWLADRR